MKRRHLWKWAGLIGLLCLALLALVPSAWAFETRGGDNVVIGPEEVIEDDLYVAAGTFTLDGTVKGDLIVVGGTIQINGTVEGDLMAAGQSVIVNGTVEDDVRIAGQVLMLGLGAEVADDVMAAGLSFESKGGSSVGGSFLFAGYQTLLAGDVAEDVQFAGGGLRLSGSVAGDVSAEVGEAEEGPPPTLFMSFMPSAAPMPSVPMGLTVDEMAHIGGNLEYTSKTEIGVAAAVVAGKTTRHEPVVEVEEERVVSPAERTTNWLLGHLRRLVTLFLVGLLMVWAVPTWTRGATKALRARPLPSLGWGVVTIALFFLALLVILVAMVLLAVIFGVITLDGLAGTAVWTGILAMALLVFFFVIAVVYITKIVISFLGGQLILARVKPEWAEGRIWPLVIGVVLFVVITAIPWLGGLISFIAVLLGLGALWLLGRQAYRQRKVAPVEIES